ncbi:MAG: hypothetical protein WC001_13560 [Desulfurivibrionaceae bacterium]
MVATCARYAPVGGGKGVVIRPVRLPQRWAAWGRVGGLVAGVSESGGGSGQNFRFSPFSTLGGEKMKTWNLEPPFIFSHEIKGIGDYTKKGLIRDPY